MKTLFTLCIILCFATLHAQNNTSSNFANAIINYEHSGTSPYEIRFAENSNITKESFWQEFKSNFFLNDEHNYSYLSELNDELGQTHYRYNQQYKNIPVLNAQFILHEKENKIIYANGHLVQNININVIPGISEQEALAKALAHINAEIYMWENPLNEDFIKSETKNFSATFFPNGELILTTGRHKLINENLKLVYRFDIYSEKPVSRNYVDVDANDGSIVNVVSKLLSGDTPGTGTTVYNGDVNIIVDSFAGEFRLRESGRGGGIQTYDMHNTTNFNSATDFIDTDTNFTDLNAQAGVSLHWAIEGTYDYYLQEHGRNSVDGNGFTLRAYAHYDNGLINAYWDGSRMLFGDGSGNAHPLTTIDISGHELTHGVTQFTANLVYQDEPGALNESFSDIFGTLVEFYLEGVTADWLIGEDFGTFRSMENPNAYDDPDTYFGSNWAALGGSDFGGVHTNSGVQNFWFYLLSEGGSGVNDNGDSYSVIGIGKEDAAKIAYRNLSVYLTPSSKYFDARHATINSTIDLFGAGSQQYLSAIEAWYAVGVYQPFLDQKVGVPDTVKFLAEISFDPDEQVINIVNIGLQPLNVTDIQLSGTHFEFVSPQSLPIELTNYEDQLPVTIKFTPTEQGMVNETLSITSNDPIFPVKVVNLKGKGFKINPAEEKVLYACSGLGNDGKTLTIDISTGQGTILGPSLFQEIKSITVHPQTGVIYGMKTSNIDSDILRINSEEGDGYYLRTINVALLAGISFDNTGNLYASTIFGEIYSVNLATGSLVMVADANSSTASITFNPFTNELWATARIFAGPNADKIFKINISNGETTTIGHTGLATITNDLAFDENGNLYGIIGGSSGVSSLISINKNSGEGNIIGDIGFENIQGLAYNVGAINSVKNEDILPTEFVLEQNYPNPFNPITTITYQLPRTSFVSLKIYNALGEQIVELVNEEVTAGVHEINFDAGSLSSGIYYYSLRASDYNSTRKMILLK